MLQGVGVGSIQCPLSAATVEVRFDWRHAKAKDGESPPSVPALLPVSIDDLRWAGPSRDPGQWNRLVLRREGETWRAELNGTALGKATLNDGNLGAGLRLFVEGRATDFASVLQLTRPE